MHGQFPYSSPRSLIKPMTRTFESFLDRLPTCGGADRFALAPSEPGFGYPSASLKQFVAPLLAERLDVQASDDPAVVVISAAGAVGKSTLAREIAFRKGSPLWDLATAKPVGHHSLIGQLTNSYGYTNSPSAFKALEAGTLFLVID